MTQIKCSFLQLVCFLSIAFTAHAQNNAPNIHLGFVYPLSTHGTFAKQFDNDFSLHALTGVSNSEKGCCIAGISNHIHKNAQGLVLSGITSTIGADAKACVLSGIASITKGFTDGAQISGIQNYSSRFNGLQLSGFSNISKNTSRGAQIAGFSNFQKDSLDGLQVAGFSNIAQNAKVQIAGFSNVVLDQVDVQVAGFINKAKKVNDVQIAGFINIADSSNYPIALINIIKNGDKSLGLQIDDDGITMLSFRSGSKKMYGILGVGLVPRSNYFSEYGLEAGLGARFPLNWYLSFNVEAAVITMSDFYNGAFMKSSLRTFPSLCLGKNLDVFGGPTFSVSTRFNRYYAPLHSWHEKINQFFMGANVGFIAGVKYHF